ncbi:ParB N-terminal domain-containing protein [Glaciibacter superstes]|uniref:ParB N-terminal domain-containing protein n=1 Tax=Glaciibacter superstes TaxID=501023 RepID=UPI0003B6D141|nr:ParB N-terminal domain-containing protein [Glaciibacter superstes]
MRANTGHIELERTIDSIVVGSRHRTELGDIDALAASIEREGLLQPPTVTPEGLLVCGARRLAALYQLGYKTVNVFVRAGISDRLQRLMAEEADNVLHKPFTQIEAAALYRELKVLMAEDAARRQETTQFGASGKIAATSGGAVTAPPLIGASGKSRIQAAMMVTGRKSYTSLEQINDLQRIANDPKQPEDVRAFARSELGSIEAGASITAAHARTHAMLAIPQDEPEPPDLEQLAVEALERAKQGRKRGVHPSVAPAAPVHYPLRAFTLTWDDLDGWWAHFDPEEVGPALSAAQWAHVETTVAATNEFFAAAREARQLRSKESA